MLYFIGRHRLIAVTDLPCRGPDPAPNSVPAHRPHAG